MEYVQIQPHELQLGQAVVDPLYDSEQRLLLARGVVVESERQRTQLLDRGLFRRIRAFKQIQPGSEDTPAEPESAGQSCQFDDIHLGVGETLQLQGQSDSNPDRYPVKLVGYLKGKSVLVTTPKQNGYVLLMREAQTFVVRFFSGKSAYAFPATVLKVVNSPFPHLHLSYPSEVRGLLVRKGMRARVKLIASVTRDGGAAHGATLHDLSIGGAMLSARERLGQQDDILTLKFRVDVSGIEQYLSLKARIRNVRDASAGDAGTAQFHHGVQFEAIDAPTRLALSAFVFQALLDDTVDL